MPTWVAGEQFKHGLGQEVGAGVAINLQGFRRMGEDLFDVVAGNGWRTDLFQFAIYFKQNRLFFFHE